jgi:uncharacterized protein (DUF1697 family)
MANRYVALLRGINVGRNKQLPMAELKRVLEGLGYADVTTYLRSGQAVFSADKAATATAAERLAADIDDAITAQLGMDVRVVVRTRAELAALLKANPFTDREADPTRLFCVFLSHKLTKPELADLDPATYEPEQFALARGGRDIYLWLPNGMGVSVLGAVKWERVSGQKDLVATARNWRTTMKLLELLDA